MDDNEVTAIENVRHESVLYMVLRGWMVDRILYDYSTVPPTQLYTLKRIPIVDGCAVSAVSQMQMELLRQEADRLHCVLRAVAEWNNNPTLEPGLPSELEQMVLSVLPPIER